MLLLLLQLSSLKRSMSKGTCHCFLRDHDNVQPKCQGSQSNTDDRSIKNQLWWKIQIQLKNNSVKLTQTEAQAAA